MYSGGWAFSNSRKSVKYPPHDQHTSGSTKAPCFKAVLFGILQKPNKSQSSQKRTQAAFIDGIRPAARAASFPPFISASVSTLLLIPFQSNKRRIFRFRAIPSTFKISSQPTPAHTTPARTHINRYNKALPIL